MLSINNQDELVQLRRMRIASLFEGTTLLLLLFVAVPLKHLAGLPSSVSVMGPVHGIAFVIYVWMLIQTVTIGSWRTVEVTRMVVAALIPFGAFINDGSLARRQSEIVRNAR